MSKEDSSLDNSDVTDEKQEDNELSIENKSQNSKQMFQESSDVTNENVKPHDNCVISLRFH